MTDELRQELRRHLIGIQTHVRGLEVAIERCDEEHQGQKYDPLIDPLLEEKNR